MTDKVLFDTNTTVQCTQYVLGSVVNRTNIFCQQKGVTSGVRHRKKPSPLDVTTFEVSIVERNPATYDATYMTSSGRMGKIGTAEYVWTNQLTRNESDSGSAGLTRALAKTSKSRASWGESLVEARSTLGMLKNRSAQFIKFAWALKRGDMRAAEKVLGITIDAKTSKRISEYTTGQRLSDGYLELQFGWKPIIDDIQAAMNLYAKGIATRGSKVNKRSGQSDITRNRQWESPDPLTSSGGFSGKVVNQHTFALNELGLLNVPELLWNVAPLSFVIDWLAQIGTLLGALTGTAGVGQVIAWRNSQTRTTYLVGPGSPTIVWYRNHKKARIPTSATLSVDVLFNGSSLGVGQWVTSLALARQQLFNGLNGNPVKGRL